MNTVTEELTKGRRDQRSRTMEAEVDDVALSQGLRAEYSKRQIFFPELSGEAAVRTSVLSDLSTLDFRLNGMINKLVFFAANHLTCSNLLRKLTSWPFPYMILSSSEAEWAVAKFWALYGKDKGNSAGHWCG